jgi:hypothetical protein
MQNEKATKSSLTPRAVDYETSFNDCQRLQDIINRLSLSEEVLESTLQVAYMIERQHNSQEGHQDRNMKEYHDISTGIQTAIRKIQGFKRTAAALEKHADGTSRLVSITQHDPRNAFKTNTHALALQLAE